MRTNQTYYSPNHLGNVLAVISDKKVAIPNTGNTLIDYFNAEITSITEYYPFGMLMPNSHGQSGDYRYGWNGAEKDDEINGSNGTSYDLGARMYDPRIGRMRSIDPWTAKYPWQSPFVYHRNSPISSIDWKGYGDEDKKATKNIPTTASTSGKNVSDDATIEALDDNKQSISQQILTKVKNKVNVEGEAKPSDITNKSLTVLNAFSKEIINSPGSNKTSLDKNLEYDDGATNDKLALTAISYTYANDPKLLSVDAANHSETIGEATTYSVDEFNKLSLNALLTASKTAKKSTLGGSGGANYETGSSKSNATTTSLQVSDSYTITKYTYEVTVNVKVKYEFDDEDILNWLGGDNSTGYINVQYRATVTVNQPLK